MGANGRADRATAGHWCPLASQISLGSRLYLAACKEEGEKGFSFNIQT